MIVKSHSPVLLAAITLLSVLCLARNAFSAEDAVQPDAQCPSFINGPPVGLACLHCTHPKAQAQAMALAAIMRESCRKRLAVNYLIDGRFGVDDDFLVNHINTLAENRRLMVIFYLSNGPSIRRSDKSVPSAFAAGLSTKKFRQQIVSNPALRARYQAIVQRAMVIKSQVPEHVRFVLVPGLEDNMTDATFQAMLDLTKAVSGDAVGYARSACTGCAPGNSGGIPYGVMKEVHTANSNHGVTQGIVTNDGDAYAFSSGPSYGAYPLSRLVSTKNAAQAQGNAFLAWTAKYQGIPIKKGKLAGRAVPNKRVYPVPTASERNDLLQLMN
jgi:hypothetical protein